MQGLVNLPSFSLGDCEDEGCNIFWFSSNKPRILLKGRLAPVANGDGSGGIKDIHVFSRNMGCGHCGIVAICFFLIYDACFSVKHGILHYI
jgi:hypothetical protein